MVTINNLLFRRDIPGDGTSSFCARDLRRSFPDAVRRSAKQRVVLPDTERRMGIVQPDRWVPPVFRKLDGWGK